MRAPEHIALAPRPSARRRRGAGRTDGARLAVPTASWPHGQAPARDAGARRRAPRPASAASSRSCRTSWARLDPVAARVLHRRGLRLRPARPDAPGRAARPQRALRHARGARARRWTGWARRVAEAYVGAQLSATRRWRVKLAQSVGKSSAQEVRRAADPRLRDRVQPVANGATPTRSPSARSSSTAALSALDRDRGAVDRGADVVAAQEARSPARSAPAGPACACSARASPRGWPACRSSSAGSRCSGRRRRRALRATAWANAITAALEAA